MRITTVVELDLVGYSDIARNLEENLDPEAVYRLQAQIQEFISTGLRAVLVQREQAILSTTGDGAILVFDHPDQAHRFAAQVHQAAADHNRQRSRASSQRWFRVGIATGDLYRPTDGVRQDIAGTVIANAVRLEAAARPGEIVMDAASFAGLPPELQNLYGPEEWISGKRDERFRGRRYVVVPRTADIARPRRRAAPRSVSIQGILLAITAALFAAAVMFWSKPGLMQAALHRLPKPRHVAVMPDYQPQTSSEDAALLSGIVESVTVQLARSERLEPDLFVLQPEELHRQRIRTVSDTQGLLGANLVLSGALRHRADSLILKWHLVQTSNARLLRETEIAGPLENLPALVDLAARGAAQLLDIDSKHWVPPAPPREAANPDAYAAYERGRGLLRGHDLPDIDRAITELQKAVDLDHNFAEAWAFLSYAQSTRYHLANDPADLALAERTSAQALKLAPHLSDAYSSRARFESYRGLYGLAIDHARVALRLDPENGDARTSLAQSYLHSGEFELAEETYEQATMNRPNDWMPLNDWADLCIEQAKYSSAERLLEQATRVAPEAALPWRNLGAVYLALYRIEDARKALSRSIDILPSGGAYSNLGTALFWEGQYRQAADAYKKAIGFAPKNPVLRRNLGDAYQMIKGMQAQARDAWQEAADLARDSLETNPNDTDMQVNRAVYEAKLGQIDSALETLSRVDSARALTVEQMFYEAQAYELVGRRDAALRLIKNCIRLGYSKDDIFHALELSNLRTDPRFKLLISSDSTK